MRLNVTNVRLIVEVVREFWFIDRLFMFFIWSAGAGLRWFCWLCRWFTFGKSRINFDPVISLLFSVRGKTNVNVNKDTINCCELFNKNTKKPIGKIWLNLQTSDFGQNSCVLTNNMRDDVFYSIGDFVQRFETLYRSLNTVLNRNISAPAVQNHLRYI